MNINYIKEFLSNKELSKIILNCKYPSRLKYNTDIISKFLKDNKIFTKSEIIYLLKNKNNLDNIHIFCPVCGNKNVFNNIKHGYSLYCCAKHASNASRQKAKNTWLNKYGVDNPNKNKEVRYKIEQTCLKKYGVKHNWSSKDPKLNGRATCLNKYNTDNVFKSEKIKNKIKQTLLNKYSVINISQTKKFKNLYNNVIWLKNKQRKEYNTKKKNNSFNTSKPEDECYNLLLNKFDKEDIIRQYKSGLYPFNCDFYIKSLDLYIECNFSHYHHFEPFNANNEEHIIELEKLKSKLNDKNQYYYIIYTWTNLDIKKLETFKKNNLNYKIFYNIKEFIEWFNNWR